MAAINGSEPFFHLFVSIINFGLVHFFKCCNNCSPNESLKYLDNNSKTLPNASKLSIDNNSNSAKFFNTGLGMYPSKEGISSFKNYDYPWQGAKYFHKDFWYNRLLKYFLSPQFEKRVSMVAGKSMCFAWSALTLAEPGSQIPLHFDEAKGGVAREHMTCIFFINGINELESGNLSIVNDNNWQDIVFQPKNLVNSLLIFNPSKDFYHGFKKIDRRKFRWSLSCAFYPK